MFLLYLDFDGVLHPSSVYCESGNKVVLRDATGHELFEHAVILESILKQFPDIRLVLSTNWVAALGFDATLSRLPPGLQKIVVGATFDPKLMDHGAFSLLGRGVQVGDDVRRREPSAWVALDDADEWWATEHRKNLILTDSKLGLGEHRAQRELINLLTRFTS